MRQPIPFGKYLLLERISVGGMAEVFKAKAFGVEGFEKIIAIKRILPTMVEDAEFIQMFIDEAKIAGQLSHANICQIFELGKITDSHFIAMEFIWGKDLLQIQNRFRKLRQPMPAGMAAWVAAKMCEGLDYAHKKKDARGNPLSIVHRDVSPQNVLVSYEGEVKLIDFGIAKASTRSSKTQAGVLKGKFGYMSPEQVRGQSMDRRSDIFAVGTILYEMLTGERLFLGESDFTTLEKVRNVDIPPLAKHSNKVPPALEKIVMKALAREPEDRYPWASALQEELIAFSMSQQPVFTAKQLAAWMKEAFTAELTRERAALEQYKKMGPSGESDKPARPESTVSLVSSSPAPRPVSQEKSEPTAPEASFEDELEQALDRTEDPLAAPTELEPRALADKARSLARSTPRPTIGETPGGKRRSTSDGNFGDEQPTEVFGEVESRPISVPQLEGESTVILPGGSSAQMTPAPTPMPRRSSAIPVAAAATPSAPTAPASPPLPSAAGLPLVADPTSTSLPSPPLAAGTPMGGSVAAPTAAPALFVAPLRIDATQHTDAVPRSARGGAVSTLWRDIGIGVGVAVLVLGVIVGARVLFGGAPAKAPAGMIVVAALDNGGGRVFLNGEVRAELAAGAEPLMLDNLPGGAYTVRVDRAGVPSCEKQVQLEPPEPELVTCPFATAVSATASLRLDVATEGVTILVDSQEISPEATREPLVLTPGVEHTITAQREGYVTQSLRVVLGAGEAQSRTIQLVPGEPVAAPPPVETPPPVAAPKPRPRPPARPRPPVEAPPVDAGPPVAVKPVAPPVDVGYLIANTTPYARVFIDDKDTGKTTPIAPRAKLAIPPGKHVVTFVVGEARFNYPIVIEAGKDHRLSKTLPTP